MSQTLDTPLVTHEIEGPDERPDGAFAGLSGWGLSLLVHGLIAVLLTSIALVKDLIPEPMPIIIHAVQEKERPEDPEPVELTVEVVDPSLEPSVIELEQPMVEDQLILPEETVDESLDEVVADLEPASDAAIAEDRLQAQAAFSQMVLGSGGGGAFSQRVGSAKRRALIRGSGSLHTENAVRKALRWFARHQAPDGAWRVAGYQSECADQPKCEPGQAHTDRCGDVACSAYAVLCFLGAGYDHRTPNTHRRTVRRGLDWLLSELGPAAVGQRFAAHDRLYHNAIATMAVVEAYGLTEDPRLRTRAQAAIDFIVASQNPDPRDASASGLGWNYTPKAVRNDASVSGWAVMALKSGRAVGLDTGSALQGAARYLAEAFAACNPRWTGASDALAGFPYTWNPQTGAVERDNLMPIGALCGLFLGWRPGDQRLTGLLNAIEQQQTPRAWPCNTYYLYYNTLAMYQAGAASWKKWNQAMQAVLLPSQRVGAGCFDGSWDWQGTRFHGHETGRLLSTAYCCLSLEVFYRYERL